ncbi:MAG: hypothetical protein HYZ73_07485 [Elusimicrobia bacterium]|nr:hypothetical protein [Elusimicrobiota bacterium]
MNTNTRAFLIGLTLMLVGCAATKVTSIKSPGVDRISRNLSIYPLLSAPATLYGRGYPASPRGVNVSQMGDNVVITPPAETQLSLTPESQMLTSLISTQFSHLGFTLKELPVEVPSGSDAITGTDKKRNTFVISLNLLNQLREKYNIQTLVIGNAFFTDSPSALTSTLEKKVSFAHLKIVDTKSLDVLAQVNLPYNDTGEEINLVAQQMADAVAKLAGIEPSQPR